MTVYQWLTLGLGAAGFLLTWMLGAFKLGRAVEAIKNDISKEIAEEKKDVLSKLEGLKDLFFEEQKSQDHNFGEVGAAMRQKIADVENQVRELEIWGRDHFVQKPEFDRATESIRQDIKEMARSIKEDFREVFAKIDGKQ